MEEKGDKAVFQLWPFRINLTTKQFSLIVLILIFGFLLVFMVYFPSYQGAIYGNQSVSPSIKSFLVISPLGMLVLIFLIAIFIIINDLFIAKKD